MLLLCVREALTHIHTLLLVGCCVYNSICPTIVREREKIDNEAKSTGISPRKTEVYDKVLGSVFAVQMFRFK